jgi:hypothetical protein
MADSAKKTNPALWDRIVKDITTGNRGGKLGQWSARKAQLAVREYKRQGGQYAGPKDPENRLRQWTREAWGTQSGEASGKTGERYLPKRARERLTDEEYAETTAKKRTDTEQGKQFSPQPAGIVQKTAKHRGHGTSARTSPKRAAANHGRRESRPPRITAAANHG